VIPVGEDAVLVEFEPEISVEVNAKVHALTRAIETAGIAGVIEVVPAYRSLMVHFQPDITSHDAVRDAIEACNGVAPSHSAAATPRLFRVPTVYGGEHGPDLASVAEQTGLAADEIVRLFSSSRYPVYCLGFLCCLAYLGGVPGALQLPRLATPRTRVPAGSVGFAGAQAVVLPVDQPSGWRYIGRAFVKMYDPTRSPPTDLRPGDLVECPAVSEDEARAWTDRPVGDCLVASAARP
jgi:KipI family sensor histidine kinase inhibitor